jgi:hypothetical protein
VVLDVRNALAKFVFPLSVVISFFEKNSHIR